MAGQHFAIRSSRTCLALMAHDGTIERIEADLQPAHTAPKPGDLLCSNLSAGGFRERSYDQPGCRYYSSSPGQIEQVGGLSAVVDLEGPGASPANVRRHAEIVIERAMARQLIAAAEISMTPDDAAPIQGANRRSGSGPWRRRTRQRTRGSHGCRGLNRWRLPRCGVRRVGAQRAAGSRRASRILIAVLVVELAEGSLVILLVAHNGKIRLISPYNVADPDSTAFLLTGRCGTRNLIDRAVSFVGRVPLAAY